MRLVQLERLSLLSRRSFRGRVKGERRSPRKGISVEFSDYRQYGIGDDLRYVDWNVYARLDRLYLKLFVDEEDLCLHLLLDASASMGFGEPSKLEHAAKLASALGFVGLVGLERVGVGVVRERMAEGFSPARGRSQVLPLMDFVGRLRPGGATSLNDGLAAYVLRSREAGLAVLISDLMDPTGYERGLKALLERRFDVHVIHVLAPEEMNPGFGGDLRLLDSETAERRQQMFGDLEKERDKLNADVENLRSFEREYRSRLKSYFTQQLESLDAGQDAGRSLGEPSTQAPKRLRSILGEDEG